MKKIITTLLFIVGLAIAAQAQYYPTPDNPAPRQWTYARVQEWRTETQRTITYMQAQLVVLRDQYAHDAAFHLGRLPVVRRHMLFNDAMRIQNKQQSILRLQDKMEEYNTFLAYR